MNKEQLENMSDFELSRSLLRKIKGNGDFFPTTESTSSCRVKLYRGGYCDFDINNLSDMMPLVFERGISLVFMDADYEAHSLENGDEANNTQHSNPLRAAAIVYLLMECE